MIVKSVMVVAPNLKKICSACKGTQSNSSEPFSGNGNNSSGFSGLPGSYRSFTGYFYPVGLGGDWWSASEFNVSDAWGWPLGSSFSKLGWVHSDKNFGLSVRCVRD